MTAPLFDAYVRRITVIEHHDGDTSHVLVDMGFDEGRKITVRWLGINAPELATPEGKQSLAALNQLLPPGTQCWLQTQKDRTEKYGRYLGRFVRDDGLDCNAQMVKNGLAESYDGGKR